MSKVLADNSLKKYRARFKPPKYNIPQSSYTIYTPSDSNAIRPSQQSGTSVISDSVRQDGPKRKPQTNSNLDDRMNVREEDARQPNSPQIEEEFFQ